VVRGVGVVGEGLAELGLEPEPELTVTLGFGGDVANTAVMAAMLGTPARIAGRVGDDALGRRLVAFWESRGVDVAHVVMDAHAPTGIYVNERGAEGLHRFDYHRRQSAGSRLEPGDVRDAFFDDLGALHLSGITLAVSPSARNAAIEAAERARSRGAVVSMAVNHRPALGGDVAGLRRAAVAADIVFVSAEETAAVFGTTPERVADALPGAAEIVVTDGGRGATLFRSGGAWALPALEVDVVDAAGAGDALAGAYLAARLAGTEPRHALRRGLVAASLSCRARGCALSYPAAAAVEEAVRA
jgi:2-dehydro-3-deoxygluconokinase